MFRLINGSAFCCLLDIESLTSSPLIESFTQPLPIYCQFIVQLCNTFVIELIDIVTLGISSSSFISASPASYLLNHAIEYELVAVQVISECMSE